MRSDAVGYFDHERERDDGLDKLKHARCICPPRCGVAAGKLNTIGQKTQGSLQRRSHQLRAIAYRFVRTYHGHFIQHSYCDEARCPNNVTMCDFQCGNGARSGHHMSKRNIPGRSFRRRSYLHDRYNRYFCFDLLAKRKSGTMMHRSPALPRARQQPLIFPCLLIWSCSSSRSEQHHL